jgi:biotin carboxylase
MNSLSVLVLGGSHSELPLIRAARNLGLRVYTSGNRPDHPGHALADHYFPGDFSDADQMTDVAMRSRCDFVVSAANDYAYLAACSVAERLDLPGFDPLDTAEVLHHKHRFKPLAVSLGMPVTHFVTLPPGVSELPARAGLSYPLVVKPVDLTGGKGISVVVNAQGLADAIANARQLSKQGVLVIEEFFQGSLHSYSTIIQDGQVVFDYADNEFCHPSPYLVSTSTSIASVPLHVLADLRDQTEKLARHLELLDGVLHCQFLYGGGSYVILEYTRRCSGDLYSEVVETVTGLRHAEQFVRRSAGLPLDLSRARPTGDYVARHCFFPDRAGRFDGIDIAPRIANWIHSVTEALPRSHVFETGWKEKAGVAVLRFPKLNDMLETRPMLNDLLRCRISAQSDASATNSKQASRVAMAS